ncbi:DUF3077 domain-containing protein [Pseudomonas sp. GB2N2]
MGLTPFIYCSNQALFRVSRDVPLGDALAMASDFLFLSKDLTREAAFNRDTDRHIWAAHYLTAMSKAVIDDAMKVLQGPPPARIEAKK